MDDGAFVVGEGAVAQPGDGAARGGDEGVAGGDEVEELDGAVDVADGGGDRAGAFEVLVGLAAALGLGVVDLAAASYAGSAEPRLSSTCTT